MSIKLVQRILFTVILIGALLSSGSAPLPGGGTSPGSATPPAGVLSETSSAAQMSMSSLGTIATEFGKITLSVDALGITTSSGNIHVDKPTNGTVRKAYLYSATMWGKPNYYTNSSVTLLGNPVVW